MTSKLALKRSSAAPRSTMSPLAKQKLASSGLTEEDAALLHILELTAAETQALSPMFKAMPSLQLNYYDPITLEPLTPQPRWPAFYRLRYLGKFTDPVSIATGKAPRYAQQANSGVCAYFPTNLDWVPILAETVRPIDFTEGEFKAAAACKAGHATIGLGGVDNWRSSKNGIPFLPELERINWVQRKVRIIFDSDIRDNQNVCRACNALAEELFQRGAIVYFVILPDLLQGGKTGLDDFLLHAKGNDPLSNLINDTAEPLTLARPLWALNEEVIYVHDPGFVINRHTDQKMKPTDFKGHAYADQQHAERVLRPDGSVSMKRVSTADRWLEWPLRSQVARLVYNPGKPHELLNGSVHTSEWNTWPGWGCEPKRGDASLFWTLLKHLFKGQQEAMHYFVQWLAYPLQYPGAKMVTMAALHGESGTGKSLIAYTMREIYGKTFNEITQKTLNSEFTEYLMNRSFVLVDDVTGHESRELYDECKSMSTRKEVRINLKNVGAYTVRDCINLMFTSNRADAFYLEDNDRRFFIHHIEIEPLEDAFYQRYDAALEMDLSREGRDKEKLRTFASAVFYDLLHYDLKGFNPNGKALVTQAKLNMIESVKTELGLWVKQLKEAPDTVLRKDRVKVEADLMTNAELLLLYKAMHSDDKRVTPRSLGMELNASKVRQVCKGQTLPVDRAPNRYYIVRNEEKWLTATRHQAVSYINNLYLKG